MATGVWKLFTNLNILFFVDKKHRKNGKSTGKTQGIWYQLERGNPDCISLWVHNRVRESKHVRHVQCSNQCPIYTFRSVLYSIYCSV